MSWLLDTNFVSEFWRPLPNPGAFAWLARQPDTSLFLSAATWAELRRGALRLAEGARRRALLAWLDEDLAARYFGRILPIDVRVADAWGEINAICERQGRRIEAMDGLIAATALIHQFTLVTRNTRDFQPTGIKVLSPWT